MTEQQIARINALAKKQKAEGLSEEEKQEQAVLRRAYIDSVKQSLGAHLDNTYIKELDGTVRPLGKKEE